MFPFLTSNKEKLYSSQSQIFIISLIILNQKSDSFEPFVKYQVTISVSSRIVIVELCSDTPRMFCVIHFFVFSFSKFRERNFIFLWGNYEKENQHCEYQKYCLLNEFSFWTLLFFNGFTSSRQR